MEKLILIITAICGISLGIYFSHMYIIYAQHQIPSVPLASLPTQTELYGTVGSIDTAAKTISMRAESPYQETEYIQIEAHYDDGTFVRNLAGEKSTASITTLNNVQFPVGARAFFNLERKSGTLHMIQILALSGV